MNLQRPTFSKLWSTLALGAALQALTPVVNAQTTPSATGSAETADTPIVNSNMNAKIMFFVLMGEFAAVAGDFAGASEYYYQIAREYKNEELFEKAVQYSLKYGSIDRLMQVSLSWRQAHPESGKANLYWLTLLIRMNQHAASLEALKSTLATNDLSTQRALLLDLGKLYANASNLADTVVLVQKALPPYLNRPDTAQYAQIGLGQLKLLAGDSEGAFVAAQAAAAMDAHDPMTLDLFFRLLEKGYMPAKAWLMTQMQQTGDSRVVNAFLDWQLRNEGSRATLKTTQTLLALYPANGEIGLMLAEQQMRASLWSQANASLKNAWAQLPPASEKDSSELLRHRILIKQAEVALRLHQPERVPALLASLSDTRFHMQKLEIRVAERIMNGDWDAGWKLLEREPEREGFRTVDKHRLFAKLLKDQGLPARALAWLDQYIPAGALDKSAQLQRALLMEKSGDVQGALAVYRTINAQFPNDAEAQNALGFSLADLGVELDKAKALISAANQALVGNPMVIDSMGWVEYRLGNFPEAMAWLELAYSIDLDPEIAAHLGEVYWKTGRHEQAIQTWQSAYDKVAPQETLIRTLERLKVKLP
jgi:tetratricopeptide (TPR) repeat protein